MNKKSKARYKAKEEEPILLADGIYHTMEGLMFKYNASTSHISRVVMDNRIEKKVLMGKVVYKDMPELFPKQERYFTVASKEPKAKDKDQSKFEFEVKARIDAQSKLLNALVESVGDKIGAISVKIDGLAGSLGNIFKSLKVLKENGEATDQNVFTVRQIVEEISTKAIERGITHYQQTEKLIELLMEFMTLPAGAEPGKILKEILDERAKQDEKQKQIKEFNARLIKKGDGVTPT